MKDQLRIYGIGLLIVIAGFFLAAQFIKPSPPKIISMATGSETGAYFAFAQQYKKVLAESGITLNIVATKGSIDNIQRLKTGEVDIAFVQSGIGQSFKDATTDQGQALVSLASVYYEPLWLFHSRDQLVDKAADLQGKSIALGPEGSGTRVLALSLLEKNGINPTNSTLLDISGQKALQQLIKGGLDYLFLVASVEAPLVKQLLSETAITAYDYDRAKAYTKRHRYLSAVELPRGVIDLSRDIPEKDINLLAAAATVVTHKELHPALVTLLMQTMEKVHSPGGILEEEGEFPSARYLDFALGDGAKRYFEYGPPLLQRYLPFWVAVLVNQMKVFLIPMLALMIPLMRLLPPVYRWRVRSRIYRWYKDLRTLEEQIKVSSDTDEKARLLAELEQLQAEVAHQSVPLSYSEELYHLRGHIEMVKQGLSP